LLITFLALRFTDHNATGETTMSISQPWIVVAILAGAASVGVATWLYVWVHRQEAGTKKAQEVASWIREGATSYLRRFYLALTRVAVGMGVVIAIVFSFDIGRLGTEAINIDPQRGGGMGSSFCDRRDMFCYRRIHGHDSCRGRQRAQRSSGK